MADVAACLVPDTSHDPEQSHFEPGHGNEGEEGGNTDDVFTDRAGDTEDDGLGPVHISDLGSAAPIVVEELPPPSVTGDPEDWAAPEPNVAAGEPAFDAVDGPFDAGSFLNGLPPAKRAKTQPAPAPSPAAKHWTPNFQQWFPGHDDERHGQVPGRPPRTCP